MLGRGTGQMNGNRGASLSRRSKSPGRHDNPSLLWGVPLSASRIDIALVVPCTGHVD